MSVSVCVCLCVCVFVSVCACVLCMYVVLVSVLHVCLCVRTCMFAHTSHMLDLKVGVFTIHCVCVHNVIVYTSCALFNLCLCHVLVDCIVAGQDEHQINTL